MRDHASNPAVLLAHAWRLSDDDLVYTGRTPLDSDLLPPRTEQDRLAGLLRDELKGITFEDARQWARRTLKDAPSELDSLATLARHCVCFEAGRPAARNGGLEYRLRCIVQVDALVCWHLVYRGQDPWHREVNKVLDWSPTLPVQRNRFDPILGREMAENHCHLGGAVSSAAMWVFALCGDDPVGGLFRGLQDTPAQEEWTRRVDGARSALLWLEALTRPGTRGNPDEVPAAGGLELRLLLGRALEQQLQFTHETPTPKWQMAPAGLEMEQLRWPLGEWVLDGRASLSVVAGERLLVWRALQALAMAGEGVAGEEYRRRVEPVLLGYLQVKNAFHQMLVPGRNGRGFYVFDRVFRRRAFYGALGSGSGPARAQMGEALERRRVGLAIDAFLEDALGYGGMPVLARLPPLDLELRVAPERGSVFVRCLRGWLRGVRDTMRRWEYPPLRVGFVLHAVKSDSPTWWDDLAVFVQGLGYLMEDRPGLRRLLVGIDVAGVERNRPPRDCARYFLEVRAMVRGQDPVAPFSWRPGFTVHVGEDFPDLVTALRHVDEAAHLLGLKPNDRLGHALALGWDIDAFYGSVKAPRLSLRERVLDLLWLLHLAAEYPRELRDEESWLTRKARELVRDAILGSNGTVDPQSLVARAVDRVGEDYRTRGQCSSEAELLAILGIPKGRWDDDLTAPADEPEHVRCAHIARRLVWKRVHDAGLFIEGNPTSNLVIGDLDGFAKLPLVLQGRAPGCATIDDLPRLHVTINTDNPGIFDTTLRSEYVRVGEALLAAKDGVDAARVCEWLDAVRVNGLNASFIPDDVPRGKDFVSVVEAAMAEPPSGWDDPPSRST